MPSYRPATETSGVQRALALSPWQQASLVRIYALVRMQRSELLIERQRILSHLAVRHL